MRKKLILACLLMSACGEQLSNNADPEYISIILEGDYAGRGGQDIDDQYTEIVEKADSTAVLAQHFGDGLDTYGGVGPLSDAVQSALSNNIEIGKAAQAINRAGAERLNAIFGYAPQLTFRASYSEISQEVVDSENEVFQGGNADYPVTNYGLELRQPIIDVAQFFTIKRSSVGKSSAAVNYVDTVKRVVFQTTDTYLRAAQSQARIEELQKRSAILSNQISAENSRVNSGLVSGSFVDDLGIEIGYLNSNLAQERATYQRALSDLSRLTGQTVGYVSRPNLAVGSNSFPSAQAAVQAAIDNNPSLLLAKVRTVENYYQDRAALAEDFAPRLDLVASYSNEDRESSLFGGSSETNITNIGAELVIPLFNEEGEGYSNLLTRVNFREGVIETSNVRRQIVADVEATYQRVAELRNAVSQAQSGLGAANRALADEQQGRDTGLLADYFVLESQKQAASAAGNVDFLQIELARAWIYLQYLTGRDIQGFI